MDEKKMKAASQKDEEKNLHAGHRKRMRRRFYETGLAGFADHEILEILLYYVYSQKNTNPLGHMLINHFGSLKAVLDADYEELVQIKGIGERGASLIKLLPQIFKIYDTSNDLNKSLKKPEARCAYFYEKLKNEKQEVLLLACLNDNLRLQYIHEIARGVPDHVVINIQKLIKTALAAGCTNFMLAHNHPMGLPLASYEDVHTTENIRRLMGEVQMKLIDHIIVADGRSISMAETGCYCCQ